MKRENRPAPILVQNPYTGKQLNIEPLFYLVRFFGSTEDLADYIDAAIRDLIVAYQHLSQDERIVLSCEISCLFDIRDMFSEINETSI